MNYRLAFDFSYERFEKALICIISIGPSTELRHILTFLFFAKMELCWDFWILFLKIVYQKGFFGEIKKIEFFDLMPDSRCLLTMALKSRLFQSTIFQVHLLSKCSHFLNLNLQSRRTLQCDWFGHSNWLRVGASQKMILRERLTCQNRGEGRGGEEKMHLHTAIACLANAHTLDRRELWVMQFGMFQLPAANQGHIGTHIFKAFSGVVFVMPWFIQILKILMLPWKNSFSC